MKRSHRLAELISPKAWASIMQTDSKEMKKKTEKKKEKKKEKKEEGKESGHDDFLFMSRAEVASPEMRKSEDPELFSPS